MHQGSNNFQVRLFANVGGSEEFVQQIVELSTLADALTIYGEERERLKQSILAVLFEGLLPAFEHLKKIRTSGGNVPELNRKQHYEDFTRVLWHAYKDLMQKAAKMMEPDLGFLFQKDTQFETGLTNWATKRPEMAPEFGRYLRQQRAEWQNELSDFRNYLEHKDDTDPQVYAPQYEPLHAGELFERVWRTIAKVLAVLISFHLPPGIRLIEIPAEHRGKINPRRFGFEAVGLTPKREG